MYKEKLTAVFDIDGFLADFEGNFCKYFGDEHRELVSLTQRYPDKADKIHKFINDPFTYQNLRADPEAVRIVQWVHKNRKNIPVDIEIVTARPIGAKRFTEKWLDKFEVPYNGLTVRQDKEDFILSLQPDIVVDDLTAVVTYLYQREQHSVKLLWKRAWNDDTIFFPRISKLEQFVRFYEKVADENLLTDSRGVRLA